ncbi:hypothetical protein NQ176_g7924 [Zarea fungicola]|uniref:Uncharacterized protein n=1 Tax=Zarea fungicola TaxID=93591 RepID=A0ACC1MVC8_9HYPO|nr:hypothetical protein NQ176_g7924 [Lecanicillium fungicola]
MAVPDLQQQRQQGSGLRCTEPQINSTSSAGPPIEATAETPPGGANAAAAVGSVDQKTSPSHDSVVTTNTTTIAAASAAAALASIESILREAVSAAPLAPGYEDEMWQNYFKHLPADTRPVKFVGEGAANAVFEIKSPQHGLQDQNFKGKVSK